MTRPGTVDEFVHSSVAGLNHSSSHRSTGSISVPIKIYAGDEGKRGKRLSLSGGTGVGPQGPFGEYLVPKAPAGQVSGLDPGLDDHEWS